MKNSEKNVLTLAYLGDAVYEIYIRTHLIKQNISKVNTLQREAIKYVSAKGQASYLAKMLENNILNDMEKEIAYRARNHKSVSHPKNTDIVTYKHATALEAIFGYLYLEKDIERIDVLMAFIIGE